MTVGAGHRLGALARLVRAPAALTVPGDVLAGAVSSGRGMDATVGAAVAASTCLYWAGMALNDYVDRELDAAERPERPIPSGAVSAGTALAVATGLTATGLGLALVAGRRSAVVALALAGVVWAYDLGLKDTAAGPLTMATARALDVLVGGCRRAALPAAVLIGGHTAVVTHLSRREVSGARRAVPATALGATGVIGLAAAVGGRAGWTTPALAGAYVAGCGRTLVAAVREPSAGRVRAAVGACINGLIPLQATVLARAGSPAAVPLAAAFPLAALLARRVSPT